MKAQTEIMGLVIVVLLLSVAMLFVVGYIAKTPPKTMKEFSTTQISANFVNTMLKTTSDNCDLFDFTELIRDCADNSGNPNQIVCSDVDGDGTDDNSCDYMQKTARLILSDTLEKWGYKNYRLNMKKMPLGEAVMSEVTVAYSGTCSGARKASPPYIIPASSSDVWINLYLCD